MSKVYQPDTLVSELREIQRRLRLLEAGAPRVATAMPAPAPVSAGIALGEPFAPARPADWPGTESAEWEPLLRAFVTPGEVRLIIETVAGAGTTGRVRLLVDGDSLATELGAGEEVSREVVELDIEGELTEIVLEGLRQSGTGSVRVAAFVLPLS
ncbi:hypothetical protein DMH01_02955 [Amycolatopsis sp. WAC 04182]|uniref:hypothetical protein n=1 Tax=Amycolatopsis sp. WAC 04182 TaxID=2203198 RepID=UPI000F7B802A|nr:hypothetical protein [Amycolatopsis sp. WAC 04182]RSN65356.1 hypothetical protein DMH01_02955 [Amycolatopsis sp. WAC 04182]